MSLNSKPFSNRFVNRQVYVNSIPRGTKKDDIQDKQIKNLKQKIKRIDSGFDLKKIDVLFPPLLPTATGSTFLLLNPVPEGTTNVTRVGDEYRLTSLHLKCNVNTETDNLKASVMRLLIFVDKQSNGADPPTIGGGSGNALLDVSGVTNIVCAPYNSSMIYERYKILIDKVIIINPQTVQNFNVGTGTTTLLNQATKHMNKKVKMSQKVNCIGTGATIASIGKGSVFAVLVTTDNTTEAATISGGVRIYYKDL